MVDIKTSRKAKSPTDVSETECERRIESDPVSTDQKFPIFCGAVGAVERRGEKARKTNAMTGEPPVEAQTLRNDGKPGYANIFRPRGHARCMSED
jgi:hypothetical protein